LQRWRARARDPLAFAHATFCLKLARAGLPRERHEGPIEYAERVSHTRPDLDIPVRRFLTLYADLRYGPRPDAAGLDTLQRLARDFHPRTSAGKRAVLEPPASLCRTSANALMQKFMLGRHPGEGRGPERIGPGFRPPPE
jgi:hypothetical protein